MKKFFKSLLSDESGQQSTKRILAIIGTLFLCVTMMLNSYSHESIKPSEDLVDAVKTIVIICIAGNVAEKFLSKK